MATLKLKIDLPDELQEVIVSMGLSPEDWFKLKVNELIDLYRASETKKLVEANKADFNSKINSAKGKAKVKKE